MATKRSGSPDLIPNPFIKKRNQAWSLEVPDAPARPSGGDTSIAPVDAATNAAIESGRAIVTDHLAHFSASLSEAVRTPFPSSAPRLSVESYRRLYEDNVGSRRGAHFVIHQHDHPVAGTHYDLRLQINETSSASWAVMYGMPGDANSVKLARNATETRVHCLWNHLIETASATTGSLLIWDTGTYTILRRRSKHAPAIDPSSQPSEGETSPEPGSPSAPENQQTEQEKLHAAFQQRKIKLQLHGTRLPEPYILNLRLTKTEDVEGRAKAKKSAEKGRRRRRAGGGKANGQPAAETTSESEEASEDDNGPKLDEPSVRELLDAEVEKGGPEEGNEETGNATDVTKKATHITEAMRLELEELEDAAVRATNAYTGAENTIGSVHQRKWFLSLDREACGFVKQARRGRKARWVREQESGKDGPGGHDSDHRHTYPFYVRGPQAERSIVTGRLGADLLRDEGVSGFVKRKGWQPVLR